MLNTTLTTVLYDQEAEQNFPYSDFSNIGRKLHNSAGCVTNIAYTGSGYSENIGLTWNGQYQLTEVTTNGTAVERNGFDALGRRAWNWNGTETNYFVYDGAQIIADVDSTGGLRRAYVWGPGLDNLLAVTVYTGAMAKTYFALTDHLGTVHALADETGSVVESYRFDGFGRVLGIYNENAQPIPESAVGNRFLWACKEYSFTTGFYHNRYRIYDPITGRFLSKDPSGISGGINEYAYSSDNPINAVDYDGLAEVWINGNRTTVNTETDLFKAMEAAGKKRPITNFRYRGHGDKHGGLVLGPGIEGEVSAGRFWQWMQQHPGYFDKNAKVYIEGCGTGNPNDVGNRVVDVFHEYLPNAEVWGFTGLSFGLSDRVPFVSIPDFNRKDRGKVPFWSKWTRVY
jgi:RHS repeat-associated protein